jgi:hypothetical protein
MTVIRIGKSSSTAAKLSVWASKTSEGHGRSVHQQKGYGFLIIVHIYKNRLIAVHAKMAIADVHFMRVSAVPFSRGFLYRPLTPIFPVGRGRSGIGQLVWQ